MEKRTVIAVVLSLLVFVVWHFVYVQPRVEEQRKIMEQRNAELVKQQTEEKKKQEAEEIIQKKEEKEIREKEKTEYKFPEAVSADIDKFITVENKYYSIKFWTKGAVAFNWKLKEHKDNDGKDLDLVNNDLKKSGYYPLAIYSKEQEETVR